MAMVYYISLHEVELRMWTDVYTSIEEFLLGRSTIMIQGLGWK